jgi:ribosomal protein L11 methyltransferase
MKIKTLSFHISPKADIEAVWQNLEAIGCSLLYSESDETGQKIFGNLPSSIKSEDLLMQYPEIVNIEPIELPEIDWDRQWSAHQNYYDGYLHVDLNIYTDKVPAKFQTTNLKLLPGPGFGDHSHPTTRLVLTLMSQIVFKKNVLDIGCGSGILSLAAVAMEAKIVCGIDIEKDAIEHSRTNSECNGMRHAVSFSLSEELQTIEDKTVVLMNMIQSEQVIAWESLGVLRENVSMIVSSGILLEGRDVYLKQCIDWGWQLMHEIKKDGWLGFVFVNGTKK